MDVLERRQGRGTHCFAGVQREYDAIAGQLVETGNHRNFEAWSKHTIAASGSVEVSAIINNPEAKTTHHQATPRRAASDLQEEIMNLTMQQSGDMEDVEMQGVRDGPIVLRSASQGLTPAAAFDAAADA